MTSWQWSEKINLYWLLRAVSYHRLRLLENSIFCFLKQNLSWCSILTGNWPSQMWGHEYRRVIQFFLFYLVLKFNGSAKRKKNCRPQCKIILRVFLGFVLYFFIFHLMKHNTIWCIFVLNKTEKKKFCMSSSTADRKKGINKMKATKAYYLNKWKNKKGKFFILFSLII